MPKTARQALLDYIKANDLSIPFGNVRGTCREIAADHEFTASAVRNVYYDLKNEQSEGKTSGEDWTAEDVGKKDYEKAEPEDPDPPPSEPLGISVLDRDYFYNEEDDLYLVFIPSLGRHIHVDGEIDRQMKRRYSNYVGDGETLNEIANSFGWGRRIFEQYKRARGWVHNEDPYTDEEHASKSTEDLVLDYASLKRGEFERAARKREWQKTVDLAKEWREWKEGTLDPFVEYVSENPPRPRAQIQKIDADSGDYLAVFSPADAHLHKLATDGSGFSATRAHLIESTERLISRVRAHGRPARCVLVLGNDFWHVDNAHGHTTKGTPQDVDGNPGPGMVAQGYEVAAEVIDRVRQLSDRVEVYVVPSNHGEWSDYHLHSGLRFGYRGQEDVQIIGCPTPRQYLEYGVNLIGLEHGDGASPKDLPAIMKDEKRQAWGRTRHGYWLTGHRHHLKEVDRSGVMIMQAPSIAPEDRYHDKAGYVLSARANVAYLFDREHGHTDRCLAIVED